MNIDIFTDGSLMKKNNIVYCGYGIHFPNGEYPDQSKSFTKPPITNNRAELYAIFKSLSICKKISKENKIISISIYSDSEYCVNIYNKWYKKWISINKDYKNKDIIDKTIHQISFFNNNTILKFIHVKSHTKNKNYQSICNDKADKLAKNGANPKP